MSSVPLSADYNKLYYNSITINELANAVEVSPNFLCPVCSERFQHPVKANVPKLPDKELDFNRQVTFTMPCCGTKITLYVAVHKSEDEKDLAICVATEPISLNWWQSA